MEDGVDFEVVTALGVLGEGACYFLLELGQYLRLFVVVISANVLPLLSTPQPLQPLLLAHLYDHLLDVGNVLV